MQRTFKAIIEPFGFEKVEPRGAHRLRLECNEPASAGERNGKLRIRHRKRSKRRLNFNTARRFSS